MNQNHCKHLPEGNGRKIIWFWLYRPTFDLPNCKSEFPVWRYTSMLLRSSLLFRTVTRRSVISSPVKSEGVTLTMVLLGLFRMIHNVSTITNLFHSATSTVCTKLYFDHSWSQPISQLWQDYFTEFQIQRYFIFHCKQYWNALKTYKHTDKELQ